MFLGTEQTSVDPSTSTEPAAVEPPTIDIPEAPSSGRLSRSTTSSTDLSEEAQTTTPSGRPSR